MPSFKKKDLEIIDFTHLKKRGLLKETPQTQQSQSAPDFFDFTQQATQPTQAKESNPLAFFDMFAQSAASTPASQTQTTKQIDDSGLTIKLENLEYQLERLTEKLLAIEEKLARFEEKVSQN